MLDVGAIRISLAIGVSTPPFVPFPSRPIYLVVLQMVLPMEGSSHVCYAHSVGKNVSIYGWIRYITKSL